MFGKLMPMPGCLVALVYADAQVSVAWAYGDAWMSLWTLPRDFLVPTENSLQAASELTRYQVSGGAFFSRQVGDVP